MTRKTTTVININGHYLSINDEVSEIGNPKAEIFSGIKYRYVGE